MYVYVDETGNTGQNIFDKDQPYFMTSALMSKKNVDLIYAHDLSTCCRKLGVPSLHAHILGEDKIEIIADDLLHICKACDARFFLSRVEKKYLAASKVFDTIFDSYENKAVPWHVYNLRHLKLLMLFKLSSYIFDDQTVQDFWDCLMEKNHDRSRLKMRDACQVFLDRVNNLPDTRSREICKDAFAWAIQNSDHITLRSAGKNAQYGHLPNMVAFSNLLDGIQRQSKAWTRDVRLIKHDRQMQFEKSLMFWHEMFSNADPAPLHWPGYPAHSFQKVFGSKFEIASSAQSPGIQIIDVVLWLMKKYFDQKPIKHSSAKIVRYVIRKSYFHDFSFDHVYRSLEKDLGEIYEKESSSEKIEEGRKLLEVFESKRRAAMHAVANGIEPAFEPDIHTIAAMRLQPKR